VFSVKILSGPMYGVDITLPDEDVFFIAAPAGEAVDENAEHVAGRASNTLFIPAGRTAPNFKLCLSSAKALEAQVFYERGAECGFEQVALLLNQPLQLGEVWLAVKPQADAWSDAVLSFIAGESAVSPNAKPMTKRRLLSFALLPLGLLLAVAAWGGGVFESRPLRGLAETIAPVAAEIMTGNDGLNYVVVGAARDVGVASRAIVRRGTEMQSVRVVSQAGEQRRLAHLLDQASIAFVTLRLDEPRKPVLLLSDTHIAFNDKAHLDEIRELLCKWAPYAEEVDIHFVAESQLQQRGRELLASAAVRYEERREGNAHVFVIRQALDDRQIAEMNNALSSFRRLWGDRHVRFFMSFDENPLHGKTFRSGTAGYLLEQDRHWIYSRAESEKFAAGS